MFQLQRDGKTIIEPKGGTGAPKLVALVHDKASAKLIAAAPEMLEALQDLVEWAERMGGFESKKWEQAKKVIKKAKKGLT